MTSPAGGVCMLVSARVDDRLRNEVSRGIRPRPEFLQLEEAHGFNLVDWAQLRPAVRRRTVRGSIEHVLEGLLHVHRARAVLSDGEHIGIPLSLAMGGLHIDRPHVMIAHHLVTARKRPFFRYLAAQRHISRAVAHSRRHVAEIQKELNVSPSWVTCIPYAVDTHFWTPAAPATGNLVVSAGREHRDYSTLASALEGEPVSVFIADSSTYSPQARRTAPTSWPSNVQRGALSPIDLRRLYARAAVVVVPLLETSFPAGITTMLEAMAMAKPVVVTGISGMSDVVRDGETALVVPVGDARRLREAVTSLLDSPSERLRIGARARDVVQAENGVEHFADELARNVVEVTGA